MSRVLFAPVLATVVFAGSTIAATLELTASEHLAAVTIAEQSTTNQDWCRDTDRNNDRDETFCEVRELKGEGSGRLEANTANGSLAVTGSSRRDVVVHVRVMARAGSMDDARDLAGEVRITLENGRLRATGPSSTFRRRSWWVSYRAEVPAEYDLTLDSSNGSITVTGVRGAIAAETSNGSLRLTDLGGKVRARTSNGSAHVTVSGSRWEGDGLSVITSNGSARLDLPQPFNAELIVGTNNGSLNVDFPVMVQGRIGRRLETTLGSGGPTLEVRTSNGSVRVGRR